MKKGKRNRKLVAVTLAMALCLGSMPFCSAAETNEQDRTKIIANLRPDYTVEKNGSYLEFYDENGKMVSPLSYDGELYLPVRAICSVMGEPVEWVDLAKTIYIGRTLSRPSKSFVKISETPYVKEVDEINIGNQEAVKAYIRKDMLIMYDFEILDLKNKEGESLYPLVCSGTTYLPIELLEDITGEIITENEKEKKIIIGEIDTEKDVYSPELTEILKLYEQQSELYNDANAKILLLNKLSKDELGILLKSTEKDYVQAQQYNRNLLNIIDGKDKDYPDEYLDILMTLQRFSEATEYYILVMQNIVYMAKTDQEFAVFAETFLNFALMSQYAMEECVSKINTVMENN